MTTDRRDDAEPTDGGDRHLEEVRQTFFSRTETRLAAVALLAIGAVWGLIELADTWTDGEHTVIDTAVMETLRAGPNYATLRGPEFFEEFIYDLTALGGYPVLSLLVLAVIGFLLLARKYRHALVTLGAIVGGVAISQALKFIYERPRPDIVPHLTEVSTFSFPSGHTMMSAVVYLTLGLLTARLVKRRLLKGYIIAAAVITTVVVGFTRVALGVHYPTDVLAGWAVGLSWALISWVVASFFARRETPDEEVGFDRSHVRRDRGSEPVAAE